MRPEHRDGLVTRIEPQKSSPYMHYDQYESSRIGMVRYIVFRNLAFLIAINAITISGILLLEGFMPLWLFVIIVIAIMIILLYKTAELYARLK